MIPGMSGRLGKGTASTCGCELGCDALTMIPPDDAESPNALDDDDDDEPIDPVDPSPSTLDTNAFLARLVLVPNASASPLAAPSASNSALGAGVVRALAPRTARATRAPLHRAACRSSLRAIARAACISHDERDARDDECDATNAMRSIALYRARRRRALSRSARRPISRRRESPSRARDARHRVTTRSFARRSTPRSSRRRGLEDSGARVPRHRPTRRDDGARAGMGARAGAPAPATPRLDVLRVSQVDAGRLDGELLDVLNAQLERVMEATSACGRATTTRATTTSASKANELRLLLDCAMFACTTGVNRPTPGMELMNLRLRDERLGDYGATTTTMKTGVEGPGLSVAQRIAYGLAKCVVGYGWGLWQRKMLRERYDEDEDDDGGGGWKYRAWKLSQTVENCYTMANFVNFCVFLRNGRYPTLLERALRARLVYQRPTMARVVDFEYLNQQLAWRELSELVLFTLPYLYSTRVRSTLGALTSHVGRGEGSPTTNVADDAPQRNRVAVQAYRCVACGCREPIHPFVAEPCGHPYCYYCLRARLVERPTSCACVKCGKRVAEMRRLATTTS